MNDDSETSIHESCQADLTTLRATLARTEENAEYWHTQCEQARPAIESLKATLARVEGLLEESNRNFWEQAQLYDRLRAERDAERERADSNFATYSAVAAERDGLRAFIEANFHKTTLEIINEREDLKEIIGDLLKKCDGLREELAKWPARYEKMCRVSYAHQELQRVANENDGLRATLEQLKSEEHGGWHDLSRPMSECQQYPCTLGRSVNNDPTGGV